MTQRVKVDRFLSLSFGMLLRKFPTGMPSPECMVFPLTLIAETPAGANTKHSRFYWFTRMIS